MLRDHNKGSLILDQLTITAQVILPAIDKTSLRYLDPSFTLSNFYRYQQLHCKLYWTHDEQNALTVQ